MFRRSRRLALIGTAALAITLTHLLPGSTDVHAAAQVPVSKSIKVTFNGSEYKPKSAPFVSSGSVYLPVRDMGELLGTMVAWNSTDKTVTMNYPELTVKLVYGSKNAAVNGKTVALTAPLLMVEGRIFVPLRFFSEATGAGVKWDPSRKTVSITRADDFIKQQVWSSIWLNRKTGEVYTARDEQSPAILVGKLNASIKGNVSFTEGGIGGGSGSVLTIVDNYGEPRVQYDAYGLFIQNNKIVSQKKASYFQRYEQNASYFQVYHPNGWLQYSVLTDGKSVTVFNEQGKAVKEYDLPALAGKDEVYSVLAIGEDYLVVRPNQTGLLTLIDLKDNTTVVLADKLLTGKDLDYAHSNDVPYHGDELLFAGDMGYGMLHFYYDSPVDDKKDSYVRLSYDRPSYEEERNALPKNRSVSELAAVCKQETIKSVDMQDGDIQYIPLVGANKEDGKSINTVCGILKKFASKGVQETGQAPITETFFHGMGISFTEGDSLELYPDSKGLAIDLGDNQRLILADSQVNRDFENLKVSLPQISVGPNPAHIGETVHITGANGEFWSETSAVSVYWMPTDSYSNTDKKALLIYTGKAKFGRYDIKFKMPASGKASDGSMKAIPLGKGRISVYDSASIEMLPAAASTAKTGK
ncbi:stalk domain-containing protein [Paenibacillus nasutitermitis]|uniref:Copper amine oxidase-like N-terminal domain-containing protein n=1 Tax=Paenibacillus nasutitermitis TaxID=1652958 RepID=A0A917DRG5_9BACL|nr:copper amine oxidase N-terminal domain-containing protein [Paenibacillus nasutitermitis]GGD59654.1 hypothetical protein GCM10010911_16820 [Paenibacillus nasutitermitis]